MTSRAYVFIDGLEDKPVICGIVELDPIAKLGKFRYGKSYQQREDAFPLDPIHLPLSEEQIITRVNHGMFGVILDAGADSWGRKLIYALHSTKPKNDLELVMAGSGMGVGALTFSLSRTASKSKHNKNSLEDMAILLQGKQAILADQALSDEVKKAFQFGSSLGGARPKTTVMEDKISYLAKFNRTDDLFNVCRVEHACMKMLSELTDLNVRVANTRLLNNHDEDILLVERFDCLESRPTHHLLSANSLINQMKVTEQSSTTFYSYGALAEFNMKYGAEPKDSHELFARMIFNICMGNTDDHSRNHAFLYSFKNKHWRLSKAYDVLPINNTRQHGIGIGAQGRLGSIDNAMSQAKRFGLNTRKAKAIANMVVELTSEWAFYFGNNGVSELDIEVLKAVVPDSSRL